MELNEDTKNKIEKNWIQEMIEREALPRVMRTDTVEDFAQKHNIDPSTYYYQSRKKENQKKILKIALSLAKKGIPEVLEKLRERAEAGDIRAIEMYLKYILKMKDKFDFTSDDKELKVITSINYILPNDNNDKTNPETTSSISGS
jgi:hypothetical protein